MNDIRDLIVSFLQEYSDLYDTIENLNDGHATAYVHNSIMKGNLTEFVVYHYIASERNLQPIPSKWYLDILANLLSYDTERQILYNYATKDGLLHGIRTHMNTLKKIFNQYNPELDVRLANQAAYLGHYFEYCVLMNKVMKLIEKHKPD